MVVTMTVTVKRMDIHRCVCRIKVLQFIGTSLDDSPRFVARSSGGAPPAAGSRMSPGPTLGVAGGRPDVGEHAARVPCWEGSDQRRRAVELNAPVANRVGPGELAGVPFDEGFGVCRDVEVLVEAGVRPANLGV